MKTFIAAPRRLATGPPPPLRNRRPLSLPLPRPKIPAAERNVGTATGAATALAAWLALAFTMLPPATTPTADVATDSPRIEILLEEFSQQQEPKPAPPNPAAAEPDFEEAAATRAAPPEAEPQPEEAPEEAVESPADTQAPPPEEQPDAPTIENWRPDSIAAAQIAELQLEAEARKKKLNTLRTNLKETIQRREVEQAGKEFLLDSDGGIEGVIRTMDFSLVDEEQAIEVLRTRYGITFETRMVKPMAGRRYLNAARGSDGTYTSAQVEGVYEVFTLSPKAVSIMSTMEIAAMQAEGFEPSKSRLREVEFGLIRDEKEPGGWRLAVIKMRAEKIR